MRNDLELISELNQELDEFSKFEQEKLITRKDWGKITFEKAKEEYSIIFSFVGKLKSLPISRLPEEPIVNIKDEIRIINELFRSIDGFEIESGNPGGQRDEFVQKIQNCSKSIHTLLVQYIPFLAYEKGDLSSSIKNFKSSQSEVEDILKKTKLSVEKQRQEINSILAKARETSASAGAAVFTENFKKEADKLKRSAKFWLKITSSLAGVTLAAALLLWFLIESGLDQGQIWQKVSTKVVILGILVAATVWCGKIYKALMHQSTVNQHRALSIQTLEAFTAAADDVQVKDAVALEAARSVFGNVSTGYIDRNNESGDGDVKIIEIAKNIMPNGKG